MAKPASVSITCANHVPDGAGESLNAAEPAHTGSTVEYHRGAGHNVAIEKPREFLDVLLPFLEENPQRARHAPSFNHRQLSHR